jgi:hypothetical protein
MKNKLFNTTTFLITVAAYFFFHHFLMKIGGDIGPHAYQILYAGAGTQPLPPNFIYYLLVWSLTLFSKDIEIIKKVSVFVLALSVGFKYRVTQYIILDYCQRLKNLQITPKLIRIIALLSLFLLIVFTIPDAWYFASRQSSFYIGRLVPNVWHNSTVIFLFPFALLLFWEQYCILAYDKTINLKKLILLVVVNILIKPSFFFIYAMTVPFFILYKFKSDKNIIKNFIPLIAGLVLIGIQTYLLFFLHYGIKIETKNALEITTPFASWKMFMPTEHILNGLLNTFALPLAFLILFFNKIIKKPYLILMVIGYFVSALLLFAFVSEAGERAIHGNFIWQCILASYLVFLAVILESIRFYSENPGKNLLKFIILFILLGAHAYSGVLYFIYIFTKSGYL